jgi:hypothetical protein
MMMTLFFPSFDAYLAAILHPPAPPPTTNSLQLQQHFQLVTNTATVNKFTCSLHPFLTLENEISCQIKVKGKAIPVTGHDGS